MKTAHLSDRDIQRFTFDLSECEEELIAHIHSCDLCKNRTAAYESIFQKVQEQQAPAFNFDLSELVMDQLPQPEEKLKVINYLSYFLITLCVVILGFTLYYFNQVSLMLFDHIAVISYYFILSVAVLIFIPLCWEMYQSFNKKMNRLEFS